MAIHEVRQPAAAKPEFFYGYVIVLATFLVMMVAWGAHYTFGVFFQPVLSEFGWTRAMTAGAFSLSVLLRALSGIGVGRLSDRFGPRITTIACGVFLGLGYSLMSQIATIWQLYLFYGAILGIGMGAAFIPLMSTVARWFVKRRAMMSGFVTAGVGTGIMVMPPVARWLITTYGWRTSYIIIGITSLVVIILVGQFLRQEPAEMGQLPDGSSVAKGGNLELSTGSVPLPKAVRTAQLWLLCAMYFSFLFGSSTVLVHIDAQATELGMSVTGAANILAAIGGASIGGRLALGALADRIGSKLAITVGFALLVTAFVYLLFAREAWMLFLFAIIYGLAHGALFTLFSPMVAELFGLGSHGVIFGVVTFAGSVGGAIGPVLAGHIFDITASYQMAFLAGGILAAIGLILSLLVRPIGSQE
jgi:MFS family permease